MERICIFFPSILIIICIAGATNFYVKLVIKRFGDNFKSVEWHEKNKRKVFWKVNIPLSGIRMPAVEELVFRAPLIIAFSAMSPLAWYGVLASGGLFAFLHWFGKKVWISEILSVYKNGEPKSDDVATEVNRISQEIGKKIMVRKVRHIIFALLLGILTGYYGIKYQSVWVSFGIHSAWNLIMPTVCSLFVLLGQLAFLGVLSLRNRVRQRRLQ